MKTHTAEYRYTDERGDLLYEVLRYPPAPGGKKDFRQRRPDGNGGWEWDLKGVKRVPYRLPQVIASQSVFIVEGEKDVHTIESLGFVGTTNSGGSNQRWLPEWSRYFQGKSVVIVPDNDAPGLKHGHQIYQSLRNVASTLKFLVLPIGKDVTDWVESGGTADQLIDLAANSPEPEIEDPAESPAVKDAERLLARGSGVNYEPAGGAKRTAWDISKMVTRDHSVMVDKTGRIWNYNARYWENIPERQLRAWALEHDFHEKPSRSRQNEAVDLTMSSTYTSEIPWRQLGPLEVPCHNGMVNVATCEVRPHRKEDYLEAVIPHAYDPACKPKLWLQVLDDYFGESAANAGFEDPDGQAKIDVIQEFFGYILLPHARYKAALICHGERDCGKSQVADVAKLLVGKGNYCVIGLDKFGDPRACAPIVGRMLNAVGDIPQDALMDDGGFKNLVSTGDAITIDPKNVHPFEYIPFCKHLICCNSLPQINDQTDAAWSRMRLVHFTRTFRRSEQKRDLIDALGLEMPGILAWAVEGADRLVRNSGHFTPISQSDKMLDDARRDANPPATFIAEEMSENSEEGSYTAMDEVRERFAKWWRKPFTPIWFGRRVKSAGHKIVQKSIDGKNIKVLLNRRGNWASS